MDKPIVYIINGSNNNEYRVSLLKFGDQISLTCTCPAGGFANNVCKHRISLLQGDTSLLKYPEQYNKNQFIETLQPSGIFEYLSKYTNAIKAVDNAKRVLKNESKAIARLMNGNNLIEK